MPARRRRTRRKATAKKRNIPTNKKLYARVKAATKSCLLYTSPSPRDKRQSRMPSSA